MFLSKYGVARHIYIPIVKRGVVDFAVSADWTPAAGDVKISKDGGAAANVTNLPTAITMGNTAMWDFSLTATEMQAAQICVTVADAATKAVEDTQFDIETYGNASAQHAVDFSDSVRAGLTALPNAAFDAAAGLFSLNSINTGATHNVTNSVGKQIRTAAGGQTTTLLSGTAQAGSTSNTIKVSAGASATDNIYVGATVVLTGGTGVGQTRRIVAYVGATKVATVDRNWVTTPDNTTTFEVDATPNALVADEGVAQAGAASTITLAATASANNSQYNGAFVTILSGTGAGQTREISAYNGATKVATVSSNWSTNPDNTSAYAVIPSGTVSQPITFNAPTVGEIFVALLQTALTEGYAADGSAPTMEQFVYMIWSALSQFVISSTTISAKKLDGLTTAMQFTMDDANNPTQRIRTS